MASFAWDKRKQGVAGQVERVFDIENVLGAATYSRDPPAVSE